MNEGSTLSAATLIDGLRQRRPRETRTAPPRRRRRREGNPFALGASRGSKDMPGEIDGCSSLAQFAVAFEQAIFRKCEGTAAGRTAEAQVRRVMHKWPRQRILFLESCFVEVAVEVAVCVVGVRARRGQLQDDDPHEMLHAGGTSAAWPRAAANLISFLNRFPASELRPILDWRGRGGPHSAGSGPTMLHDH